MIKKNIYNIDLSNSFNSSISSGAQYVKPKVEIDFLDSRHAFNKVIVTNDPHLSNSEGDLGYYFAPIQLFNGNDRQGYTWAVAGALDNNGKVIKADGNWYAMPPNRSDNFEFGWWSNSKSTSNLHNQYNGYAFTTPITLTTTFNPRKCNYITVSAPEYSGQIDTYMLTVRSSDPGVPNPLYQEIVRIPDGNYQYTHFLPDTLGHSTINRVDIEIYTTKNPTDHARLNGINILYREDVSDYVVSYSQSKIRDLHETSLPIAGTDSGSVTIDLDNTEKKFNLFGSTSDYGPFMRKDLRVKVSSGWKIYDNEDQYITGSLRSPLSNSSNTITLIDNTPFPDGGVGDYFVVEIDPNSVNREYVLCSGKSNNYDLNVVERGFNNSIPRNHAQGVDIRCETFEYPTATEYFVDEWNSSTGSMITSMVCADWSKYLSERVLTGGFFVEKSTVPEACESLILFSNFPKADIKSLNRFDISARKSGAILHYDFNELSLDRSGNEVTVSDGLRCRFFAMPSDSIDKVTDITADALDRELSQLEKALGESVFVSPTFSTNSIEISSSNTTMALNLADSSVSMNGFSFTDSTGNPYSEYFNSVYDGYYIPYESGEQYIVIKIAMGGVRVFIDDTIVLDKWRVNSVDAGQYVTLESEELNLVAGNPYKIRIETFHKSGAFRIKLEKAIGAFSPVPVAPDEVRTVAVVDRIGTRDASFQPSSESRNKQQNYGVFVGSPTIGLSGGIPSDTSNRYCQTTSTSYIRIPYHLSLDLPNSNSKNYIDGNWSIEYYAKVNGSYSSDGEYISNYSNSNSSSGFEFYNTSSANGFKVKTSSGEINLSANSTLSNTSFTHVMVTFDGSDISYFVNGQKRDSESVSGTILNWSNKDITIGGRGSYYDENTGEVAPSTVRQLSIDEFLMYPRSFSEDEVADRYTESQMKELTIYPFLYGGEVSIREVIDEISLADLGRFYIDEENIARYEHYYKFWEPTIDQHANVQLIIDDENSIVSADYVVQLQANKIVVKISGISSNLTGVQPLWRADDPTTLAVVELTANMTSSDTSMYVTTTDDPPFAKAGYLIVDNEIIKYNNKTGNLFLELERGQFGSTAASHSANTNVREVRYWDLKFDKAPAFQVKSPFITGIRFEEPDEISILRYVPSAYGAELIIAASNNVAPGSIIFAEGTNPITQKVAFTSIAGIPILISEQNSQVKEQTAAIESCICIYGVKEVVIENKFITDFIHAQKIADFIIEKNVLPVPVLNVQTYPNPLVKVGDRLKISELDAFDIINGEYWVVARSYTYGDSMSETLTLRKVS